MTAAVPVAVHEDDGRRPLTMFGPDFPFPYDDYLASPAGLGSVPAATFGTEVAVIGGGLAGVVAAYELTRLGLKPVVYEAGEIGGRLRSVGFDGHPGIVAEMGAMRFPPSSRAFFHYVRECGLATHRFPNPLDDATQSTVVDIKGRTHYARTLDDLPEIYRTVADAWTETLVTRGHRDEMEAAIRARDVPTIKRIWNALVPLLDDQTFYGFLCESPAFASFTHRELFGQVGFGTGGWDTDFPNSILEILRVVFTGADEQHVGIDGGCQQLPELLWAREARCAHWPDGTSVRSLHDGGRPRPAVTRLRRDAGGDVAILDADGRESRFGAVVYTAQGWMLLSTIDCDESLLPVDHWTAIERTHYMGSSKLFVLVDRPFWKDIDPRTGRDTMSITLTDRMTRGTYLLDQGRGQPGLMCLSYTWADDSLKWLALSADERLAVMLKSLGEIYPDVDIRSHIISAPVTVSWETERDFMGAFKANLPGHYRYQERLFSHFMQDGFEPRHRGLFLAGDDVSWTAGWAEGAVQTAINAVWGVVHHLGGATPPDNPGPGDRFAELAPLRLGDVQ
ncbi:MAG: lysine 2-monooxygenase [Frankiaceae bacterium]|nr:lysine 2-monooxygenase [Frankiaceae bacterium]